MGTGLAGFGGAGGAAGAGGFNLGGGMSGGQVRDASLPNLETRTCGLLHCHLPSKTPRRGPDTGITALQLAW